MNKLSDLLNDLRLNLSVAAGAIALLTGFLLGWDDMLLWRIASALYGAGVVGWVVVRFVRICKTGIVPQDFDDGEIDVRPGPTANTLREFLQPLFFALFIGLLWATWADCEVSPPWLSCVFILISGAFAVINLDYYKRRNQA